MNGLFTWDLGKGEHSRILFKKDDIELAELVYNPKSTERENLSAGIKDWTVPTVPPKAGHCVATYQERFARRNENDLPV